jgi:hypothetical protein
MKEMKPKPKPVKQEPKAVRRVGAMRFTKCGTFRGFNYG